MECLILMHLACKMKLIYLTNDVHIIVLSFQSLFPCMSLVLNFSDFMLSL
ncbi:hypothetical protein Sjap_014623 [Stephania japonica]|uniref:Uncharacterized protein n=1 Tax=Stephania japonica TaxID=461633 RepID=A0AAP0NT74_9MAGN